MTTARLIVTAACTCALALGGCGDDAVQLDATVDGDVLDGGVDVQGAEAGADLTVDAVVDTLAPDTAPDTLAPDTTPAPDTTVDTALPPDMPTVFDMPVAPDAPPGDTGVVTDLPLPPDLSPAPDTGPTYPCQLVIGKPCTKGGGQCGATNTCLLTSGTKGVCTCACTPDDPSTPLVNEDSCPNLTKNACGTVETSVGTTLNACFQTCSPKLGANDCQGDIACLPSSGLAVGLWKSAVCYYYGCTSDADCPVTTAKTCTVGSSTAGCPTGQTCEAVVSGHTDGLCSQAGNCDAKSGLCGVHKLGTATAKVGDPCASDLDCAGNMTCLIEIDQSKYRKKWKASCTMDAECCSGVCSSGSCTKGLCTVDNRNGYCTIAGCQFASTLTSAACPTGSTCNHLYAGGLCQKTCALNTASDCRNHAGDLLGDYECRAWDNLYISGVGAVAASPVCDFGTQMPCSFFGGSSVLDCTVVGTTTNATNMQCRDLAGKQLTSTSDPTGYCLDITSSGSKTRSPLPTP